MIHLMEHTILDVLKTVPFLFVAFLIIEYIEHKVKNKSNSLRKEKLGPFIGSLLGVVPQCGFSVLATNLFSSKVITIGTLLAVYLSTSDEVIPLLIAGGASSKIIIFIILVKIIVATLFGYLFDLFFKKKINRDFSLCEDDDCHCEDGLLKSSLIHTIKITLFILVVTFLLNLLIHYLGEDKIGAILLKDNFFGPFISSLVGLIPNCAASVIVSELYLNGVISIGMLISGFLTGSGLGLLVLLKVNKNKKENLIILISLYLIGSFIGVLIDLFGIVI